MKICIAFALASLMLLIAGCGQNGSLPPSPGVLPACENYWVSNTGNDVSGDGSASTPFQTLERAREAVRSDPKRGQCPIAVNIEPGTYTLAAPLAFNAGDSGSILAPVTYQAAPASSAPVILSGGMPVALTCAGAVCTGTVPDLPPHSLPRQFYVNDQRATRARSNYPLDNPDEQINPNYVRVPTGYTQIFPETLTHPELVEAVTITQWKMMRCPAASMSGGTLVMAQPCWNNANTYPSPWNFQLLSWLENAPEFLNNPLTGEPIPNTWYLDPYAKKLTYINTGDGAPQNAVLPILENLVELTGTPNAPVTNITFRGLQFSYATWMEPNPAGWQGPDSDTTSDSANGYVADQSGNILKGNTYSANIIGHQKIVYNTPGNVTLRYARRIAFDGDTFTHLGAAALDLDTGSQDNRIVNNTFTDISSSAVEVGGFTPQDMRPTSAQETSTNLIANNSISYTGADYFDSAAIFVGYSTGTVVTQNTINHVPWSAVAIGWGWGLLDQGSFPGLPGATRGMWGQYETPTIMSDNVISNNLFENFLEKLWDGGAIYTNGSQGPNFIHGLLIKQNVAIEKRPAAGSNIYYTDGGSRYITLVQNVSIENQVGTVNFGPCISGTSSIYPACLATGLLPYGADMGGCLPVGHFQYLQNYFQDTTDFYGPQICHNDLIPPFPVDLTFLNNVKISSFTQVPDWILDQAGVR
jgi:hypothetical protein